MAKENANISNLLETKSKRAPVSPHTPTSGDREITKLAKAAGVGLLGSLIMFLFITLSIQSGAAPFNIPPSAALLESLGLNVDAFALVVHFAYGAFWSIVLVRFCKEKTTLGKGILLALGLWLFMMVVYSPIIGWGLFGFGRAGELASDHPLYLEPGPKYLIATLVLHLIYGAIVGWLNRLWIKFGKSTV